MLRPYGITSAHNDKRRPNAPAPSTAASALCADVSALSAESSALCAGAWALSAEVSAVSPWLRARNAAVLDCTTERQPRRSPANSSRRRTPAPHQEEPVANDRSYRIKPQYIEADRTALTALRGLRNYAPVNPAYRVEALSTLDQALVQAKQNEILAQNALAAARDAAVAAEWAMHDAMLGAKAQVIAQYGDDSDAIQALGLKKKSKRRRPISRASRDV